MHSPDWSDLLEHYAPGTEPSLYRDLFAKLRAAAPATVAAPRGRRPLSGPNCWPCPSAGAGWACATRCAASPPRPRRADVEAIELDQPLHDLGLDSLMAVELRNLLGVAIEAELPATLLFEHPSVSALVDHLLADHLAPSRRRRAGRRRRRGRHPPPSRPWSDADGHSRAADVDELARTPGRPPRPAGEADE